MSQVHPTDWHGESIEDFQLTHNRILAMSVQRVTRSTRLFATAFKSNSWKSYSTS
jgi:hypothetical protein